MPPPTLIVKRWNHRISTALAATSSRAGHKEELAIGRYQYSQGLGRIDAGADAVSMS